MSPPLVLVLALSMLLAGCRTQPREESAEPDPGGAAPSPLRDATAAFFDDATASRWGAAYARTSAAYREAVPLDAFSAAMARSPWFRQGAKFETPGGSTEYPKKVARLEGWTVSPAGMAWTSVYFGYEEDHWAITGILMGGEPGLPTAALPVATGKDAGRR